MPINVKVGADTSAFKTGLAEMENQVTGFASRLGGTLVGAFGFEAIRQGIMSAIDAGDQLQDISEKFGVSASKLQMLGNAASVYGSSLDNISAGLNKLSLAQQKAISGDEGLQKTFSEVGVSLTDLSNMTVEDIFLKISDSFASGANEGRQFVIVNELLGKAQTDLIKVMNQGSEAIMAQGSSMGVWSDETIAALSAASDALKTLQNNFTVFFGNLAIGINSAVERYQDLIEAVYLHIRANRDEQLDAAGRANLYEQSAAKVGDVIYGRSQIQQPQSSQPSRQRGLHDDEESGRIALKAAQDLERAQERLAQAIRDRETLEMDANQKLGRAQAELVALQAEINALQVNSIDQINKKADAEKKAAEIMQLQADYAKDAARATDDQATASERIANMQANLQRLQAEREGPKEELNLQQKITKQASEKANATGRMEDEITKQQEALRLQHMLEQKYASQGLDEVSAQRKARNYVYNLVGPNATFGEFKPSVSISKPSPITLDAPDITISKPSPITLDAPNIEKAKDNENKPFDPAQANADFNKQVANFQNNINMITSTIAKIPTQNTVISVSVPGMDQVVDRLEKLIRTAGEFK